MREYNLESLNTGVKISMKIAEYKQDKTNIVIYDDYIEERNTEILNKKICEICAKYFNSKNLHN